VIDSKVYDVSQFANLHPGGANVLYADSVGEPLLMRLEGPSIIFNAAGNDATQAFFGLHRHEILLKPQYARLQIGKIRSQEEVIKALAPGELSAVPYAEPSWLAEGFYSPYYTQNHRQFQKAVRKFFVEIIYPEAVRCEENGKRISQEVFDQLRCAV
jgi:prepilin-type processing-associated H-X9-DG protein